MTGTQRFRMIWMRLVIGALPTELQCLLASRHVDMHNLTKLQPNEVFLRALVWIVNVNTWFGGSL